MADKQVEIYDEALPTPKRDPLETWERGRIVFEDGRMKWVKDRLTEDR